MLKFYIRRISSLSIASFLCAGVLSSCAYLPDWVGGEDKVKAEGNRIALLSAEQELSSDAEATAIPFAMPVESATANIPATSVSYEGRPDHYALSREPTRVSTIDLRTENSGDNAYLPPIIGAGRMFTLDAEGTLRCIEGDDFSTTCWDISLPGEGTFRYGGLLLREGVLYVNGGGVHAFAIDASTGDILWKRVLSGVIRGTPAIFGSMVVFGTLTGRTYALDRSTGDSRWTHEGEQTTLAYTGAGSPVVYKDVVFVPYPSGEIFALNADNGTSYWSRRPEERYLRARTAIALKDSGITPQIYRGFVFLAANSGHLSINDVRSGAPIWQKEISVIREPWAAADDVFVLTEGNRLIAVHVPTGGIRWIRDLPAFKHEKRKRGSIRMTAPILAGGHIYVAADNGKMYAIAPDTGKISSTISIPDNVRNAPLLAKGKLYVTARDGKTFIFE